MSTEPVEFMRRPQRWDVQFGPEMTDPDVDRLLTLEPFRSVDARQFPASASLRDILRNDTRILKFKRGDVIVREGDYGESAFLILSGSVTVALQALDPHILGRRATKKKSFFKAIAQRWTNPDNVEVLDSSRLKVLSQTGSLSSADDGATGIFLQDVDKVLSSVHTDRLEAGAIFGELAALGRCARTSTIIADGDAELLEMRWQGLRDIRARSDGIRQAIDRRYRENALQSQLRSTSIFKHLGEAELKEVADATEFETYGTFDWNTSYKSLAQQDPAVRLKQEPIIAEEGHYPNGLIIVRAGFVRVSHRHGNGHKTISYLGSGQYAGLEELAHNLLVADPLLNMPLQHTLRAVGYVNILRVPTPMIEKHVLQQMLAPIAEKKRRSFRPAPRPKTSDEPSPDLVDPAKLEFLADNRFINGTQTMMIDMDRCTRCDDCVRACASAHENNPRFIRHGPIHGHHMIANACMHCQDPVCMIGCPTGAIHRDTVTGNVLINASTCIGCATCANSCPYNSIRMVEARNDRGLPILDQTTSAPIFKATKCDLCADQWGGPACERACPHDALMRVDMKDMESLGSWLRR
jgi:Fe-S-cluster-containing dehydrogenase component/CRP-like cAMP-binding protein